MRSRFPCPGTDAALALLRPQHAVLSAEANAYVAAGLRVLKKYDAAERTKLTVSLERYRQQLEKLVEAVDVRLLVFDNVEQFHSELRTITPAVRGVPPAPGRQSKAPLPPITPRSKAAAASAASASDSAASDAGAPPTVAPASGPQPALLEDFVHEEARVHSLIDRVETWKDESRHFLRLHREIEAQQAAGSPSPSSSELKRIGEQILKILPERATLESAVHMPPPLAGLPRELPRFTPEPGARSQSRIFADSPEPGSPLGRSPTPNGHAPPTYSLNDSLTASDIRSWLEAHPEFEVNSDLRQRQQIRVKREAEERARREAEAERVKTGVAPVGRTFSGSTPIQHVSQTRRDTLLQLTKNVSISIDKATVLEAIVENARVLAHADRCAVFIIDRERRMLASTISVQGDNAVQRHMISIPLGTGIAGHVAATGATVNIADAYQDARFNQSIDRDTGYHTKSVLCLPIRDASGEIIGVTQLVNKRASDSELAYLGASGSPAATRGKLGRSRAAAAAVAERELLASVTAFTRDDEILLEEFSSYCAVSMANAELYNRSQAAVARSDLLLTLARAVYSSLDQDSVVGSIVHHAKELVGADRCALFLVDEERDELVSTVASGTTPIRMSRTSGIAGAALTSGKVVCIDDAYADKRFNQDVDQETGYRTKSILSAPIWSPDTDRHVSAVIQLVNKISDESVFTQDDVEAVNIFALFCGIALRNAAEHQESIVGQKRSQVALELICYHSRATDADVSDYRSAGVTPETMEETKRFGYSLATRRRAELAAYMVGWLKLLGLVDHFEIPLETAIRFSLSLSKNYRVVPYHNFGHAAEVTHSMFTYLSNCAQMRHYSKVETFGMIVACMCHDVDHRGVNNDFMVLADSPLATIYNGTSVMERHHWAHSVMLMNSEGQNMFATVDPVELRELWAIVKARVLDTDMSSYAARLKELKAAIDSPAGLDLATRRGRDLLSPVLMTACDISSVTKPWADCRMWAERVAEEFYRQGDMEKSLGHTPVPLNDREKSTLPSMQVGFIQFVAQPLFSCVASVLPASGIIVEQMTENQKTWKRLVDDHAVHIDPASVVDHEAELIRAGKPYAQGADAPSAEEEAERATRVERMDSRLSELNMAATASTRVANGDKVTDPEEKIAYMRRRLEDLDAEKARRQESSKPMFRPTQVKSKAKPANSSSSLRSVDSNASSVGSTASSDAMGRKLDELNKAAAGLATVEKGGKIEDPDEKLAFMRRRLNELEAEKDEREEKAEQEQAAVKIQSSFRGKQARAEVEEKKREKTSGKADDDDDKAEQEQAAVKIQSSFRGKKARAEVEEKKREKTLGKADDDDDKAEQLSEEQKARIAHMENRLVEMDKEAAEELAESGKLTAGQEARLDEIQKRLAKLNGHA